MLTPVQIRMLRFIEAEVARTGGAPSLREMAAALGYKNAPAASRTLAKLVDHGAIRRAPRLPRGIEVVQTGDAVEREAEAVECLRKLVALADSVGAPGWDRAMDWARRIVSPAPADP